jgi:hypothetical protein
MRLDDVVTRRIIKALLKGEDYRVEIVTLIDTEFLSFVLEHIKLLHASKLNNVDNENWYQLDFLDSKLDKVDLAINSGLNMKTIHNMYNSSTKATVESAAKNHYEVLNDLIVDFDESDPNYNSELKVEIDGHSVFFTFAELLMAINTVSVKRAALRGGAWSTAGKRVEKPLMETLCKLYKVDPSNYEARIKANESPDGEDGFVREIDFYLINRDPIKIEYKCEVKLMGKGNPESADAVIARDSKVFVADMLSETNRSQLNSLEVEWVQLREPKKGFRKFEEVLDNLGIAHGKLDPKFEDKLDSVLDEVFS